MMETPLLRVSRPVSACARCRNAKIRCDGKLPACSACERAGRGSECSSANDLFAKGKERSYVASLELRIERLERQIAQARTQHRVNESQNRPPRALSAASNAKRKEEALDVDDIVCDFGYLVLNATSTGYNGFDKEMSFDRLTLSTAELAKLPRSNGLRLPPRETAMALVQTCIKNEFSVYPALTETAIYGAVESAYQHHGQYSSPKDIWNVRIVLAIGLLSASTRKDDANHEIAARHVAVALENAHAVLQPGRADTAQAVVLLTLYSLLDPTYFSPWYLLSIAIRVWLDIGLHQEPAHLKRSPPTAQNHRRLFYCMYSLDRALAFSHVRLLSFTDEAVDVTLPLGPASTRFSNEEIYGTPQAYGGDYFHLLARFRQIQSQYYQKLFGSRRDMLYEPWYNRPQDIVQLRTAYDEMTEYANEAQKCILGLDLYYMIVLLLRPSENQPGLDAYGVHMLFDASLSYAQILHWIVQRKEFAICCTRLELLRAIRVLRSLIFVLKDHSCPVFEDVAPREPPSLLGNHLPTIVKRSPSEAVTGAVDFCTDMETSLDILLQRCDPPAELAEIKADLRTNLHVLRTRQLSYRAHGAIENHGSYHADHQSYTDGSWQTYQGPTHRGPS